MKKKNSKAVKWMDGEEIQELMTRYAKLASSQMLANYRVSDGHYLVTGAGRRLAASTPMFTAAVLARRPLRALWQLGINRETFIGLFTAPLGADYDTFFLRLRFPALDDKMSPAEAESAVKAYRKLFIRRPAYTGAPDDYEEIGRYLRDVVCDDEKAACESCIMVYEEDAVMLNKAHEAIEDYFVACARLAKDIGSETAKTWLEALRLFGIKSELEMKREMTYGFVRSRAYIEQIWDLAAEATEKLWVDCQFALLKPLKRARKGA